MFFFYHVCAPTDPLIVPHLRRVVRVAHSSLNRSVSKYETIKPAGFPSALAALFVFLEHEVAVWNLTLGK